MTKIKTPVTPQECVDHIKKYNYGVGFGASDMLKKLSLLKGADLAQEIEDDLFNYGVTIEDCEHGVYLRELMKANGIYPDYGDENIQLEKRLEMCRVEFVSDPSLYR